jgi:hypothetical protein
MARRKREDRGEKRTAFIGFQLTPSERAALEHGAAKVGASLSQHARELCLRRSGGAQIVAKTRRNPTAAALMAELAAIGNNLNQLARVANTNRATPQLHELQTTTDMLKAALAKVLAL